MSSFLKTCCFSLQTGAKVVGLLSLSCGIGGFILALTTFDSGNFSADHFENMDEWNDPSTDSLDTRSLLHSSTQIIGSILTMFFAGLVLVASWKNRMPGLLLPWLILHALSALTGIGFSLYSAILHAFEQEMSMGIGYAAATVGIAAIGSCCWLVIFRYYCQLREVFKKINTEHFPEE